MGHPSSYTPAWGNVSLFGKEIHFSLQMWLDEDLAWQRLSKTQSVLPSTDVPPPNFFILMALTVSQSSNVHFIFKDSFHFT